MVKQKLENNKEVENDGGHNPNPSLWTCYTINLSRDFIFHHRDGEIGNLKDLFLGFFIENDFLAFSSKCPD